ncbi:MAG TPA: twin-arginine translocase TatA/TatE family subunit [Gemmatimonadales bacterium]|jgi:sec-independent protein translocase protein TatA|nr:twin-arginine translocase TatA/TatE family subunit [Gemmatimonadales bacterium]
MFEGLSLTHILLFLVILLLLFGAKRLPEIGGALGKSIGEFKKSMRDIQTDMNQPSSHVPPAPTPPPPASSQPSVQQSLPPTDRRTN